MEIFKSMLVATHKFYSLKIGLQTRYEEWLKKVANGHPDSVSTITVTTTPILSYNTPVNHVRRERVAHYKDNKIAIKGTLNKLKRLLDVKPPITHCKVVRLMGLMDVPLEKYVAQRVDILLRKYFTNKMKTFTDDTFKNNFFNMAPPFKPTNTVNITWKRDLKGLMKLHMDSEGLLIKRPTERLTAIIKYCSPIINIAYKEFDDTLPGQSIEEAFVQRVNRYNEYATLINNISAYSKFNSSSLIFSYFKRANTATSFNTVYSILSDITSSWDVEKVLLGHLLMEKLDDDTDAAVNDPYNIVSFGGFPYEQIRPAIRAEYTLLKILTYLGVRFGFSITDMYQRMFLHPTDSFAVDNVLQLFPGLMTIMFYLINVLKDKEGGLYLSDLNYKLLALTSSKRHFGDRQEAIEAHKQISFIVEKVVLRCVDILVVNVTSPAIIAEYCNILFLKSGLIREASY